MRDFRSFLLIAIALFAMTDTGFAQKKSKKEKKAEEAVTTASGDNTVKSLTREALFINAMQAKVLGNYNEAILRFNAIIKEDPRNHAAYFQLGQIYYYLQQYDKAELNTNTALKYQPGNEWYNLLLAQIKAEKGDYAGAADVYGVVSSYFPDEIEYYYDRAYMLSQAKKFKEAIAVYDAIEKKTGLQEELIVQKELLYMQLNDINGAVKEVQKLIDSDPKEFRYYGYLGEIYENNGKYDQAIKAYKEILKIDPVNVMGIYSLANAYEKAGKNKEHESLLIQSFQNDSLGIDDKIQVLIPIIQKQASPDSSQANRALLDKLSNILLTLYPGDVKALTVKADIQYSLGENNEAIETYKAVVAQPEVPATVWLQLFTLLSDTERYDELLDFTDKGLKAYPDDAIFYFFRGLAATIKKDYPLAQRSYETGLTKDLPTEALRLQMLTGLGDISSELKDYAKADSSYEKALEIDPNSAIVLNNYAYFLCLRQENIERAERMSKKSNLLVENNPAYLDTYAWILYHKGAYNEALKWIEKAVKAMDNAPSAEILDHYGDILFKLEKVDNAVYYWEKALELDGSRDYLKEKIRKRSLND